VDEPITPHIVRLVIPPKGKRYYFCDDCNSSVPTKLDVTIDHKILNVDFEILVVDLRKK